MADKGANSYSNIIFSCVILLMSVILLAHLQMRPPLPEIATKEPLGPYAFPKALLWGIIIISSYVIIKDIIIIRMKKHKVEWVTLFTIDDDLKTTLIIAASLLTYIVLIRLMGFFLTSFLWLSVVFYIFGTKSIKKVLAISLPVTVALNLIFIVALNVTFPRGVGVFYHISRLLGQ